MNTVYKNILCYLIEKEEKKFFFDFFLDSRTTPEKLRILFFAAVTIPFIGLVKESLIPTRSHSVKTNLTRGRSLLR